MLKAEIDRICITTKYNQEYVFRCEDKIVSDTWEVYRLKFQGYPDDLYIYNDSYDWDLIRPARPVQTITVFSLRRKG